MQREPVWTEARKLFRDVTNHSNIYAWVCEEDGYCIYLSLGWHLFTGNLDGEGYNWLNDIHPDDRPHTSQTFFEANSSQAEYVVGYRLRCQDGTYKTALARGMPTFNAKGEYQGIVGFTEIETQGHRLCPTRSLKSPLTEREKEVLALFAEGHTAETAAAVLGIGKQTVDKHAQSAASKLSALNKTHAVVLALTLKEISVPETV